MEDLIINIFVLIFAPIVMGLMIFCKFFSNNSIIIRRFAKWFSVAYFIYSCLFFINCNTNMQFDFTKSLDIIPLGIFGSSFSFATDGFSSLLCAFMAFIVFICFVCSKSEIKVKHRLYYSFVLFLEGTFCAILCAKDFYILSVSLLASIYFGYILMSEFLSKARIKTSKTYLIQNFGAVLFFMICAVILKFYAQNTTGLNIWEISNSADIIPDYASLFCFVAFLYLCAIKIPIFPFHKTLYNALSAMNPALICVYLFEFCTGLFLFIRFNIYALKDAFALFAPIVAIAGAINICYFGVLALKETDLKKSFPYFCFSQTGTLLCALSSVSKEGLSGAIFEIPVLATLFCGICLCFYFASDANKTSKLPLMGGLAVKMPKLAACYFLLLLCVVAIPLSGNFAGRLLCTLGSFSTQINSEIIIWLCAFITCIGYILGVFYTINAMQKIFFGPNVLIQKKSPVLLRHRFFALCLLSVLGFLFGIFSNILLVPITKYSEMIISAFLL